MTHLFGVHCQKISKSKIVPLWRDICPFEKISCKTPLEIELVIYILGCLINNSILCASWQKKVFLKNDASTALWFPYNIRTNILDLWYINSVQQVRIHGEKVILPARSCDSSTCKINFNFWKGWKVQLFQFGGSMPYLALYAFHKGLVPNFGIF